MDRRKKKQFIAIGIVGVLAAIGFGLYLASQKGYLDQWEIEPVLNCSETGPEMLFLKAETAYDQGRFLIARKAFKQLDKCFGKEAIPGQLKLFADEDDESVSQIARGRLKQIQCELQKVKSTRNLEPEELAEKIFDALRNGNQPELTSYFDCRGLAGEVGKEFDIADPISVGLVLTRDSARAKLQTPRKDLTQYTLTIDEVGDLGRVRMFLCKKHDQWLWTYLISGELGEEVGKESDLNPCLSEHLEKQSLLFRPFRPNSREWAS